MCVVSYNVIDVVVTVFIITYPSSSLIWHLGGHADGKISPLLHF